MKLGSYLVGISIAALAGTVAGRLVFPPVDPRQAGESEDTAAAKKDAANSRPQRSGPGTAAPERLLGKFRAVRSGITSSTRARLEAWLMLQKMTEEELADLAGRISRAESSGNAQGFIRSLFIRYAEINPKAAFEAGLALPGTDMRGSACFAALELWGKEAPVEALDFMLEDPRFSAENLKSYLFDAFEALARHDPHEAVRRLGEARRTKWDNTFPDPSWYRDARDSVFWGWQDTDADAARQWLFSHAGDTPEEKRRLVETVCGALCEEDPREALQFAISLPPDEMAARAVEEVIAYWIDYEPDEAIEAFLELPPERRAIATRNFGTNAMKRLSREKVLQVASGFPEGATTAPFWNGLVRRRAYDEKFDDAVEFLARLPDGHHRERSTVLIAEEWARTNPSEASEWLRTLDPGKARDEAVIAFSAPLALVDPASAVKWVETVGDDQRRRQVLAGRAAGWLKEDRAAAAKWIGSSTDLDDRTKRTLLGE